MKLACFVTLLYVVCWPTLVCAETMPRNSTEPAPADALPWRGMGTLPLTTNVLSRTVESSGLMNAAIHGDPARTVEQTAHVLTEAAVCAPPGCNTLERPQPQYPTVKLTGFFQADSGVLTRIWQVRRGWETFRTVPPSDGPDWVLTARPGTTPAI